MSKKILREESISLEEVKDFLKARDEEAPLNYIQRVTLDYAHRFSKDFPHQVDFIEQMIKEFNIPKPKVIQLINILPETIEDVDLIIGRDFSKETKEEVLRKIREHIAMYADEIVDEVETGNIDDF